MTNLSQQTQPTLTSLEVAELCESRHSDVTAKIKKLMTKGVLRESRKTPRRVIPDGGGRPALVYDLTKRDSLVVVSGFRDDIRARVIDRWFELEQHALPEPPPPPPTSLPNFQDPIAAARAWADAQEQAQQVRQQLEAAQPDLEFVERFVSAESGSLGFRETCKELRVNEREFRAWLYEKRIMYRLSGKWVPYQEHLEAGRFVMRVGVSEESGHAYSQARFTPKGFRWITLLWSNRTNTD